MGNNLSRIIDNDLIYNDYVQCNNNNLEDFEKYKYYQKLIKNIVRPCFDLRGKVEDEPIEIIKDNEIIGYKFKNMRYCQTNYIFRLGNPFYEKSIENLIMCHKLDLDCSFVVCSEKYKNPSEMETFFAFKIFPRYAIVDELGEIIKKYDKYEKCESSEMYKLLEKTRCELIRLHLENKMQKQEIKKLKHELEKY